MSRADLCTFDGLVSQMGLQGGVYAREWSKATVSLDCNSFAATIVFKGQ